MEETVKPPHQPDQITKVLRWVVGVVLGAVVLAAALIGLAYVASPEAVRHPASTHYHLRLQVVSDGKMVNFADNAYQTPLNTDTCSAALTKEPIHFHDNLDQFVHIHWAHVTGGLLLKNYGWNVVGGLPGALGYRFDTLPQLARVPIHGYVLPRPPAEANYYVYTGDNTGYKERSWQDFLHQDLDTFFGHKISTAAGPARQDWLVSTAQAHDSHTGAPDLEAELTELNHVVGSVVIFAQKDRPTGQQIKERFDHLVALPESSCGG